MLEMVDVLSSWTYVEEEDLLYIRRDLIQRGFSYLGKFFSSDRCLEQKRFRV